MAEITIIGLGPGRPEHLTREAWETLMTANEVWLRTKHHPVVRDLISIRNLQSFDDVYETSATFEAVYGQIVEKIIHLGQRPEGVIYAVPGHPFVGESTVMNIVKQAESQGIPVRIIEGLSFIEPTIKALSCDALDGLQIFDALEITSYHHPPINPDYPALIAQVYSRSIASNLKLVLMNQYPDEHPVIMIDGAGTDHETIIHMPLFEIDREERSPLSTLFVSSYESVSSFEGFQETIARLRSPEGCPWDRKQTHETLRMNLLEESYEVLSAIDSGDEDNLMEELGDLLLQVVLQTQVAIDEGEFQMVDVISSIDAKLKRRHPHVWQGLVIDGVQDVVANWETIKKQERRLNGQTNQSMLDGIPKALPALTQAYAYADRIERIGMQLSHVSHLAAYIQKGIQRMHESEMPENQEQLLGKILFAIVLWALHYGIDPESALREINNRFADNFREIEQRKTAGSLDSVPDDELWKLWASPQIQ